MEHVARGMSDSNVYFFNLDYRIYLNYRVQLGYRQLFEFSIMAGTRRRS